MKGSNNYTAQDIERYHSGQLSFAERHALEKAALDDPFLADALEGYAFTTSPVVDLNSLQQRLQNRIEEKEKRRGVFLMNAGWMKIAALFILLVGAGWLVFQTFSGKKEEVVASQTPEKKNDIVVKLPSQDSNLTVYNNIAPNVTINQSETIQKDQQETIQKGRTVNRLPGINRESDKSLDGGHAQLSPSTFSIQQQDSLRNEVAYQTEQTERLRKEESKAYDSSLTNATAVLRDKYSSYGNSTMRDDTLKNFDVVLKKQDLPLSEVVIVNKSTQKPEAKKRMQVIVDTLEPAEGWNHFDDYIANNLKEPEEFKSKPITGGEVELAFEVNKQGEPVNITVTKSLCEKCDQEAIRLLKEGPKWKNKVKKGKVKIKF